MLQIKNTRTKNLNFTIIIGLVICFFFLPLASALFAGKLTASVSGMFYSRLIIWADVALIFIYAHKAEHQKVLLWQEKIYSVSFYLSAILVLMLLQFGARIISAIPLLFGWHENLTILAKTIHIAKSNNWLFAFTIITAGITEELLFRGYIQTRLALFFEHKYIPILISSVMFAALHYKYHSLMELLFTFSIGVITATHYQKYRSIAILIVFHILIDFFSVFISK